jgi:T5orf172 domain
VSGDSPCDRESGRINDPVAYVYALVDEVRKETKIGMSWHPGSRLRAEQRRFGKHLYLKSTWKFPTWKDAHAIEQDLHRNLTNGEGEWFNFLPEVNRETWEDVCDQFDRAERGITDSKGAETWIMEEEIRRKGESDRQTEESYRSLETQAESILKLLTEDQKNILRSYWFLRGKNFA